MLKLFTLCIDTCIDSLYKTVFYSIEGFSTDPLTCIYYRIFQIIMSSWAILVNNRFKMSPKKNASSFANIKTNLTLSCIISFSLISGT